MTVDSSAEFPLYISVNLALTSKDSFDDRDDNSTWLPFSLLPSLPSAKHRQPPSRLHTVYTCSIVLFSGFLFFSFFFSWYSIKSSLMLILLEFRLILSHMGCTNVHGHSVSPGLTRLEVQLHHTWGTRLASYIPVMHPPQTGSIYLHRLVSLSLVTAWILLTIKRTSLPLFACCKWSNAGGSESLRIKEGQIVEINYHCQVFDEKRCLVGSFLVMYQGGRVVKALDLRSNVRMHTWVRTPFLVMGPCRPTVFLFFFSPQITCLFFFFFFFLQHYNL